VDDQTYESVYYGGWLLVSLAAYTVMRLGWWRPKDCDPGDYWAVAAGLGLFWPILPFLPIVLFWGRRQEKRRKTT